MNGELYQISCIVAAAKKALKEGLPMEYTPMKSENKSEFLFLSGSETAQGDNYTAGNPQEWFEYCVKKGMQDVALLCSHSVEGRMHLGFANTDDKVILCFFENGDVTFFTPYWQFDASQRKWNITYTEQEWINPPLGKPHYEDNTDSFRQVLEDIKKLAVKIECENFVKVFDRAIKYLDGFDDWDDIKYGLTLPAIPLENMHLFEAASVADVFGAMGSWNDVPPNMAHEKGLDTEYNDLSDKLLRNTRLAVLFAVNEW